MLSVDMAEKVLDTALDAAQKAMVALADSIQAGNVDGHEQQTAVTAMALIHSKALALCSIHPQYKVVFDSIVRSTIDVELSTLRTAVRKGEGPL